MARVSLKTPSCWSAQRALVECLFSQDADLLREARRRQQAGEHFIGVVYAHQLNIIAGGIADLEIIAKSSNLADCLNHVTFLPL